MASDDGRAAVVPDRREGASCPGAAPPSGAPPAAGLSRMVARQLSRWLRGAPPAAVAAPAPRAPAGTADPTIDGLRAKERFLSTLLDNLPGFAYRCRNDRAWTIEFISAGVRRITGYQPADFMEGRVSLGLDVIHPDHRARIWHAVQDALARGEAFQFSYPITTADGSVRWMWEQGRAVHGCHGTFEALEGFITDISDRVRAEQALSESDRALESAQEVAHVGSWSYEADRPQRLRCSGEMCRILGLSPGELDGPAESFLAMVHPADAQRVDAAHQAALRHGVGFDLEHRIVRRDGTVRWVHNRAELMRDARGRPQLLAGVCQDVTEQKALRERVAQAQTMEALGRLAGGIAHDFHQLFRVIAARTQSLLAQTGPADARRVDLEQIQEMGGRAEQLTRRLLALGSRQPFHPQELDLSALVARLRPRLQQEVGDGVPVELDTAPQPCPVVADADMVEQLLLDLCVRARDAMPGGGRLAVSLSTVAADAEFRRLRAWAEHDHYAVLAVTDTGRRIEPADLQRVFEPGRVCEGGPVGVGLLLAAVHAMAAQHGGAVEVESTMRVGSTFRVYLPLAPATAAAQGSPARGASQTLLPA